MIRSIDKLTEETSTGYSFNRYTRAGWRNCVKELRLRGYSDEQVVAVMLSKHMRWCADFSGKPYGKVTSADFFRYFDDKCNRLTETNVNELVAGTNWQPRD